MSTPGTAPDRTRDGSWLFARYAYAPNRLGYCGPADSAALLGYGATGADGAVPADLRKLARGFSGAWPYLVILARLAGIEDPLDRRVVESYWLGGGVESTVDRREFGRALLAAITPQAGHHWRHLTPEILSEAAPNHCFHVFGVYPWSRLLGQAGFEQPLHVLDNCRIRWGTVLAVSGDEIEVSSRRLTWNGTELGLSEPRAERVALSTGGQSFLRGVASGEEIALHWDWATDWLTGEQVDALHQATLAQVDVTNRRLAGKTRG